MPQMVQGIHIYIPEMKPSLYLICCKVSRIERFHYGYAIGLAIVIIIYCRKSDSSSTISSTDASSGITGKIFIFSSDV